MVQRILKLPDHHSFFLFGPRGVGKTTLLQERMPKTKTYVIDLLDFDTESRIIQRPKEFSEILAALPDSIEWVVIDEVQKVPFLLDEVHRHIEANSNRFFALTGSSARKLKRGQANLLAGRAFVYHLAPLTSIELGNQFHLDKALAHGTLPKAWTLSSDEERNSFLRAYAGTYLKEEIQNEGFIRQLDGFRRFLPIVGTENGTILSWNNIAQEVGINAKTVRSYFEILEDTLLGSFLPAFHRSIRKRQRTHPKFYLFDAGVKRALAQELHVPLVPGTDAYGRAFEHFWIIELMRMSAYNEADFQFSYFATHDMEIDLVIERPNAPLLFVEIKSAERVRDQALRPLRSVVKSVPGSEGICISREPRKRYTESILVCPWQEALEAVGLHHE
jgi:uncharacterized protein